MQRTTWIDHEYIISEISQSQRETKCSMWLHLYEVSKIVKPNRKQSRELNGGY